MAIDKALLLKGVAGMAAAGSVVTVVSLSYGEEKAAEGAEASEIKGNQGEGSQAVNEQQQKQQQAQIREEDEGKKKERDEKMKAINDKLTPLGLDGCLFTEGDIADINSFSKDCVLDKDKFQKIHFSNWGNDGVTVEGWSGNNTVTLNISNKPGEDNGLKYLFKDIRDKLTIKSNPESSENTVTLRPNTEREFEVEDDKLKKKVDGELSKKLKGYNEKFKSTFKFPDTCAFDDTEEETSIECSLSKDDLKKIEFSNREDADLDVGGITDEERITLKIERTTEGAETLKYKLKNNSQTNDLTISKSGQSSQEDKITLRANTEREFEESNNKLGKKVNQTLSASLVVYNDKLGTLKLPESCKFDKTEGDESIECSLSEEDLKKINFSNKNGDTDLEIGGYDGAQKVTLKVERVKTQDSESLKYTFKNNSTTKNLTITGSNQEKTKITLKANTEREFEENESKLTKKPQDEATSTKLKGFNKNLQDLAVPAGCRFDDTENDLKMECSIYEGQITKIKFWNKEEETDLTIEEGASFTGLKLALDGTNENLKYVFKGADRDIKLKEGNKTFTIKKNVDTEFEFKETYLRRPRKVKTVADLVNLNCTYSDEKGSSGTCKLSSSYINVRSKGTSSSSISFGSSSKIKEKKSQVTFNFSEYEDGFEKNVKFTFSGNEDIEDNGEKLEKNADYEAKESGGVKYLSKKDNGGLGG